jgi:hypothetical protein
LQKKKQNFDFIFIYYSEGMHIKRWAVLCFINYK